MELAGHSNKLGVIKMEIWRDIPNYEGYYQASTEGRIRSLTRLRIDGYHITGRILKPNRLKDGYEQVYLTVDGVGKDKKVHRLIAETFIPNPQHKPQVNHINGIKHDNRLKNLEWCTASENLIHAYRFLGYVNPRAALGKPSVNRKLTMEQVELIKADNRSQTVIAKDYGVCQQTISNIKTGKCYVTNRRKRGGRR